MQVAVGIATLREVTETTDEVRRGAGAAIGIGYDWWIADGWSLGVLGRFALATTGSARDPAGARDGGTLGTAPALLIAATYH
jgi:hypothetical protein